MSTNVNTLATLFTNKGVAGANALIYSGTDTQFSSTNGRVVATLFRVQNSTGSAINKPTATIIGKRTRSFFITTSETQDS